MYYLTITNSVVLPVVDDEDGERLSVFSWKYSGANGRGLGSIQRKQNDEMISLASEVMGKPGFMFDHIDRNPFNNQKINLRQCTNQQNCCNKNRPKKNPSSIYRGVYWSKDRNKWRAALKVEYNTINLGQYKTEREAAIAYNNAAIIHHGQFASLNII